MKNKSEGGLSGILSAGCIFEGLIKFSGTFRIDGSVFGRIVCNNEGPSTVIITESATVEADIIADNVIISGNVSGNIKAVERLELIAPGRLEGLVYTSDFSIEDKALFQGECIMIRHLSDEDKMALKAEGFYEIHHQFLNQNRQSIQELPEKTTLIDH